MATMRRLRRAPWNKGKIVGQKAPLKLREILAIRVRLQLRRNLRDLALFNLDLQLPEMDGYEATARLRAEPRFDTLPIIAMTAHAMSEERAQCLRLGMNDHISKPIDPGALYRLLEAWLGNGMRHS